MAKNPSHMDVTPDRLRHRCNRQLVGTMDWRAARAHISSSTTDGKPRNSTIWGSEAPCSVASFTNDPIMANMADATNIQRACIEGPGNERRTEIGESDTILPLRNACGREGTAVPRAGQKRRHCFAKDPEKHETRFPVRHYQPGRTGRAVGHPAHPGCRPLHHRAGHRYPGAADPVGRHRL